MSIRRWLVGCCVVGSGLVLAGLGCSSASGKDVFQSGAGGATAGSGGAPGGSGGILNIDGGAGNGQGGILNTTPPCGAGDPTVDNDGDGWSPQDGDCNDCTEQMNPGAYDYPGNNVDEDCNGVPDDEPVGCDQGLPLDGNNPMDAAKALGLCKVAQPNAWPQRTWGVLEARYVFADGSVQSGPPDGFAAMCTGNGGQGSPPNALSHGVLPKFGGAVGPREGASLVALSSGVAREGVNGDSPGGAYMCTQSPTPWGFPTPSTAACPGQQIDDTPVANDPIALELVIRAPTNVKSLSFDFDFYTYEYPDYICTQFNDFFVALLFSGHPDVPANKNVSFDSKGNPVSVNNGFLEVCTAGTHNGKTFPCSLGTTELNGTGFEGHAATGWLQTKTPVLPGEEFTLRFAIWDMGDEILDSSVLVDNFKWDVNEGETQTDRPPPK